MTEDRFWELCEEGSRVFGLGLMWLLCWPIMLVGLVAQALRRRP